MKKPDILLINPWIYDFKAYDFWMKPMGLLYVASVLKRSEYGVHFIDCLDNTSRLAPQKSKESFGCGGFYSEEVEKPSLYAVIPRKYKRYGIPLSAFARKLDKIPTPSAILVTSMMTYWYQGPFNVIELVKERFPSSPVILGGVYCRLCNDHARQFSKADILYSSSCLEDLTAQLGEITGYKKRDHQKSLSQYLPPLYEMIEGSEYAPLLTSTGCPYQCAYCASNILFPEFIQKDPLQVFEELCDAIARLGIRDVAFYDDALLINSKHHLEVFLKMVIEQRLAVRFHTPNALHARHLSRDAAVLMKRANFHTIRLGLEFSTASLQYESGGKVTSEEVKEAISNLHNAGFQPEQTGVYIMCGIPGAGYDEIERALLLVGRLKAVSRLVEFSPIPGTRMGDEFLRLDSNPSRDPLCHNNTYHTCRSTTLPFEAFKKLKDLSLSLNRRALG